jgi:hypothetical protein
VPVEHRGEQGEVAVWRLRDAMRVSPSAERGEALGRRLRMSAVRSLEQRRAGRRHQLVPRERVEAEPRVTDRRARGLLAAGRAHGEQLCERGPARAGQPRLLHELGDGVERGREQLLVLLAEEVLGDQRLHAAPQRLDPQRELGKGTRVGCAELLLERGDLRLVARGDRAQGGLSPRHRDFELRDVDEDVAGRIDRQLDPLPRLHEVALSRASSATA